MRRICRRATIVACIVAALAPLRLTAQVPDTTRAPRPLPTLGVESAPASQIISPRRAFFYSFFAPGSAQSILRRPTSGAIFVGVEAGALAMVAKSLGDLRAARRLARDSIITGYTTADSVTKPVKARTAGAARAQSRIPARRAFVEDWITIVIVNHFISGAEAYVAANLWDVPVDVTVAPAENGRALVGARLAW